jgi:hypothetical protein
MIKFFIGGVLHLFLDFLIASDRRVPLVERLRRYFPSMVNSHKAGCVRFLLDVEVGVRNVFGRVISGWSTGRRGDSVQRIADTCEQAVKAGESAVVHGGII